MKREVFYTLRYIKIPFVTRKYAFYKKKCSRTGNGREYLWNFSPTCSIRVSSQILYMAPKIRTILKIERTRNVIVYIRCFLGNFLYETGFFLYILRMLISIFFSIRIRVKIFPSKKGDIFHYCFVSCLKKTSSNI